MGYGRFKCKIPSLRLNSSVGYGRTLQTACGPFLLAGYDQVQRDSANKNIYIYIYI